MSFWWTRGALPLLAALAAVPAFVLPADAQVSTSATPARPSGSPGLPAEWWLAQLNAQQAWASAPERGAGVTVAVLSTGVDPKHQDLAGNVITGPDYTGSGRGQGSASGGAEGTAVASLIAGHGHGAGGAQGITGIVPRARILSVRVTLDYNDPLSGHADITRHLPDAIARGIQYAVGHGAGVIALPPDPAAPGQSRAPSPAAGDSAAERAAVRDALAHNVLLVAPAGDDAMSGGGTDYPAAYPGVIAVGATGNNGKLAPFSSTRSYVALTASGAGLTAAAPDGKYATLSSTALSSALAAGVAALARARYPALSAAQVTQAMEHGVVPASLAKPGTGAGALSAAGTVTAAASAFSLTGNPMPNPAPAWNAYVTNRGRHKAGGLLASPASRYAAAGTGALIVVLITVLAAASFRRRREESRARARMDDALRHGIPTGGSRAGHGSQQRPGMPVQPGASPAAIAQSDTAASRASAVDALLSRNSRAIHPPWEVADRLRDGAGNSAPSTGTPRRPD